MDEVDPKSTRRRGLWATLAIATVAGASVVTIALPATSKADPEVPTPVPPTTAAAPPATATTTPPPGTPGSPAAQPGDPNATPALAHRMETAAGDLEVELFALMMMGDDRAVRQTYVAGAPMKFDLTGQRVTSPPRERQPFMPPA